MLSSVPNLRISIACHLAQVGGETPMSQNTTSLPTTFFCLCRVPHLLTEGGIEPPASSETGTGAPPDARPRLHVPIRFITTSRLRARREIVVRSGCPPREIECGEQLACPSRDCCEELGAPHTEFEYDEQISYSPRLYCGEPMPPA